MIKEIKYSGHTASASDYLAPDGELIASMGLVPEDGSLKPVQPPHCVLQLTDSYNVNYVHETSQFKNYIVSKDNEFHWITDDNQTITSDNLLTSFGSLTIYNVSSIGNTLLILTSNGMYYFKYVVGESAYRVLGNHMPELPISFGLVGSYDKEDVAWLLEHEFSIIKQDVNTYEEDSDHSKVFTESVLAKVNKFIQEKVTEKNKFIFPFFIRYAYRLYDGSVTMQSAPVLMVASTDISPECYILGFTEAVDNTGYYAIRKITARVEAMCSQIDYVVTNGTSISLLEDWEEIIASIDVFISKPIYSYDQNGNITKIAKVDNSNDLNKSYSIAKQLRVNNVYTYGTIYDNAYRKASSCDRMQQERLDQSAAYRFVLPRRKQSDIFDDIRDCNLFYHIKSIAIEDLKTTRTILTFDNEKLKTLTTQEVLPDDYDSHCNLIPKFSYNYNSRLNLSGLNKILFRGYNADTSFIYSSYQTQKTICIHYYIKSNGVINVVSTDANGTSMGNDNPLVFLYYPDINAYKAIIEIGTTFYEQSYKKIYEVPLKPHSTLNGAYYFEGWEGICTEEREISALPSDIETYSNNILQMPNKIYTSEVNNPFYFPLLGINTVGSGEIIGICSAAKALSQGQFGQFPLYAFTTEGVWALSVSDTGSYSAKQPITRDVCMSAESITQLDSAVLFATDRGIMLISGSDSQCITDTIDNMLALDDAAELPLLTSVMTQYGYNYQMKFAPLHKFLVGSRMLYAYVPQRIIIYNPQYDYAYVYSLKSKVWGMMPSTIKSNVPSYPEALAMLSNNKLVDFCENEVDANNKYVTPYKGMLITRPLKLDMPDTLKTIDTVIQRGEFEKGHVKTLCYGSRDLYNWFYVNSSKDHYLRGFRGTPYKYFKLVSLCSMDVGETLSGATVQHTPREINQPR